MKKRLKKYVNWFLTRSFSCRLVHDQFCVDTDMDVWQRLKCQGLSPRGVIDVGAAHGCWTRQFKKLYSDVKIAMVDPLEENLASLKCTCEDLHDVTYWQGVLGTNIGEANFFVHGAQSSMFNSEWGGVSSMRCVPMMTLDNLVQRLGIDQVDALKLDVQGAELEVLRGGPNVLKMCNVVQVEVIFRKIYDGAPLAQEVVGFFHKNGFRIYDIASVMKRKDHALLQADLFFVRDEALFLPESWEKSE